MAPNLLSEMYRARRIAMLRRDEDDGANWLVITQPEHAALSGRLAQEWAAIPAPRRATLLAVYEHDNGHGLSDANGHWNPQSGEVQDFRSAPKELQAAIARRGVERLAAESPYAALLVAIHFGQQAAKERLLAQLRANPVTAEDTTTERINAGYQLLQACDVLSLAVCLGIERFNSSKDTPAFRPAGRPLLDLTFDHRGGGVIGLAPWPFARERVTARVTARVIPARRYPSADALADAFHNAALRDISVGFEPA
jgi:uncharacterized protein DUF3891